MKVVHILLGKANPNRMNGVNKVVHNLASTQKDMLHDVEVLGLTNTPEVDKIKRNYKIYFFKRKKIKIDRNLKKYLQDLDKTYTVVHIHGGFIFDFYLIAKLLKKNGVNYIFTSHGCYNYLAIQKNKYLKKIFFLLFDRYVLKHAWKAHFLGKSEYSYIDVLIKNINKILIPNGQNMQELNFNYKRLKRKKSPVFGFLGRIDIYHKGLDILIQGFLDYKKNGGSGVLWIIGDGGDMKKILSSYNTNDIIFFGSKFGNDKLNLIANMDVFIHTSRFEGFPMAVLEASGLGVPLLISENTNFGDYVRESECGIVISKNNSKEVADSLSKYENLYINGELNLISQNSVNMIKSTFNWTTISEKLLFDCKKLNSQ